MVRLVELWDLWHFLPISSRQRLHSLDLVELPGSRRIPLKENEMSFQLHWISMQHQVLSFLNSS